MSRLASVASAAASFILLSSCNLVSSLKTDATGQTWLLTNDAGQVATVVVTPFTNSGTFSETSGSAGWWIDYTNVGGTRVRIPVSGTISHTSPGDHWYFTVTVMSGSVRLLGTGEGYSNGNYPNASGASGTLKGTLTDPGGTLQRHQDKNPAGLRHVRCTTRRWAGLEFASLCGRGPGPAGCGQGDRSARGV